ncbi:MAG: hypothetical protein GY804_04380, partial [Alphaproteobacteria bacterium]|nr:hypothetical protein [Alphaproteobacteria bacterium]
SKETKQKVVEVVEKEESKSSLDLDMAELTTKAQKAELMKPIQTEELNRFKIEKEKLDLLKKAGDLQETKFAEFLYYGYIEKIQQDIISMTKKLRPKIESEVQEGNTLNVVKLIEKEIKSILISIQKSQKRDVKEWRKTL